MGKLGFIGLGIMGRPMAENLLKGGQQGMVSDLNEAVVEELRKQGAESGSYTDLAKACDIIFTILPTGAIVQEVLFGENGVASALGYTLAICLFAGIRERLALNNMPKWMEGFTGAMITAGLMAVAFNGFSGLI